MAVIYTPADGDMQDRVTRLIKKHHEHLLECVEGGVDVRVLMAEEEDPEKRPVKLGGYTCLAIVGKTGAKERTQGLGDATIIVDGPAWEELSENQREALIDHELTHIEPQVDSKGRWKLDAQQRPVIKMRLHDWRLGGFAVISERYGGSAPEIRDVQSASDRFGQLFWNWEDAPLATKGAPRKAKDIVGSIEPRSVRMAASGSSSCGSGGGDAASTMVQGAKIRSGSDGEFVHKVGEALKDMGVKVIDRRASSDLPPPMIRGKDKNLTFTYKDRERLTDVLARGKKKRSGKRGAAPKAGRVKKGGLRR